VAQQSSHQWQQVFKKMDGELQIVETACCGMGGLFGHQKELKQLSLDIWDIHWAKHEPKESDTLATGFSCRSQAKRIENIELRHPLEIISNSIH
jgi:Fe-S oxidoreductase